MTNLFNLQKAKPLFVLIMLLCMSAALWAVPAKPGLKRVLTLTDGTTITAQLVGDEHGHFWLGQDGRAYQAVSGSDVFQLIDKTEVTKRAQTRRAAANQQRMRRLAPRKVGSIGNYTGQKKGLIILVNFKDKTFNATQEDFRKLANQPNYESGNYKGSMYDYFLAQSEGQFKLTFDVVGPVTVSQNYSYYGANDSHGDDLRPTEMVIEALKLADSQVNYADYDWDSDGEVDQVYVVYAGKGEADGGASNTIWPHAWQLSSASYNGAQRLDGVKIDTYACGGEQNGSTGETAGIGTMCHEFSHCLGYPDFYDTDYSGGQGMFEWDLMDSGSYNGDGYLPAGYTGWERWVAGWKEPIELLSTQTVTDMKALADGGNTYIIYNQGNKNEYYMLENRQQMKWDGGVPGEGLLIVHVDYSASVWANNEPNNDPSHQRMTWVAADNEYQYTTYQGSKYYTTAGAKNDPFPYGNVNAFNKSTTPAAKFYNKNLDGSYYMDSSIEEITQWSDGTISFNFRGLSNVSKPTFSPAAGRYEEAQTVAISCETEGATIYYTLDGTTPTASSTAYTEPLTISETTTIKAIAVKDGEESEVVTAKYTIGASASDPDTKTFQRVASVADLEPGMRYIIACGSKSTAAGALSNQILGSESVTVNGDIVTIDDGVSVFVLEETTNGWTFQNESTSQYLYATAAKKLAYGTTANAWTLGDGNDGVIMTYSNSSFGTMLYNASSPRFTTYTSSPTTSMIQANLYMEYSDEVTVEKQDVTLTFQPQTITGTMGEDGRFVEPSLKIVPEGADIAVSYSSSNENVATVDASTGEVTFVAPGTAVITASFDGDDHYNAATPATYTLTVLAADQPVQGTGRYQLVTKIDDLESGKNYLIVSGAKAYNGFNTNKGDAGDVTISENIIDLSVTGNQAVPVVLTKESASTWGTYWSIYDTGVEAYLTALSGNKLGTTNSYSVGRPSWTIDVSSNGTATIQNYNNDAYLKYNSKDDMFRAYTSGQTAISLYKEIEEPVVEEITVSIGSTGYATLYYSDKNLTVPEGVEAYTYTITDGKLEESWFYEADDVIPQGTAVILKDLVTLKEGETSHDYAFIVTTTEGDVDDDNLLMGFDEDAETVGPDGATEGYKFYMLSLDKNSTPGSVGFYYGAPKGEAFTSKGHKAYLPVDVTAASGKSFFLFGDAQSGTTDINNVQSSKFKAESADIYDLSGRKIVGSKLQPGIYIKNGRKVVVK